MGFKGRIVSYNCYTAIADFIKENKSKWILPIHTKNMLYSKSQNALHFHIPQTNPDVITIDTREFDCNNISKSIFGGDSLPILTPRIFNDHSTQLITVNSDSPRFVESPRQAVVESPRHTNAEDVISYYLRTHDDKVEVLNNFLKDIFADSYNIISSVNLMFVQEYTKGWRLDFKLNY